MKKVGRNDPCLCGSGKKYKKCCMNLKGTQVLMQDYPPKRVDHPIQFGEIRRIPNNLKITKPTNVKEPSKKISSLFEDQSIIGAIDWDKQRTAKFYRKLLSYSTNRAKKFDLSITDHQFYKELVFDIKFQKHANSIYWNEIDQYIYQYKCNTHNLICERISKAINHFNDHLTSSSIIRQIIELVINAIANQWVITSSYNHLKRIVSEPGFKNCNGVTWKDLEDFAISLTSLSKKNIKVMSQLISVDFDILKDKLYKPLDYEPTTFQQFRIAEWVAKNFDEEKISHGVTFLNLINEIEKLYRYLCKFLHPTPLMFPIDKSVKDYSDKDVFLSVKITAIKTLDLCISLYEKLSEDQVFYFCRYQDLVEDKLKLYSYSKRLNIFEIKDTFIKDVMNRYKGLILKTTKGDIELVKLNNFSERTKTLAKKYEKFSIKNKNEIDKFINNLENA